MAYYVVYVQICAHLAYFLLFDKKFMLTTK